jgi:predicted alpha/beta-fold hydrolase
MACFESRRIAHQFEARSFQPKGLWTTNGHFQTIVGSGALRKGLFGDPPRSFLTKEERMETPDGDYFMVEYTENFEDTGDVVIVVHGMESSSKSGLVTNMTTALMRQGFGCCLYNFRGCHGQENL